MKTISQYIIQILEDCVLSIAIYMCKHMSDTVTLWTVFLYQL